MKKMMQAYLFRDDLNHKFFLSLRNKINKYFYKEYGKEVKFGKPLFVKHPQFISIGNRVSIRSGIRLEPIVEWRGKKMRPELTIGDDVVIEQNCHIICANHVAIQAGVLISSNVFISDCEHRYKDIKKKILLQGLNLKETVIGRDSFIGTGAKILAGVTIGQHCVIGANCVVNKDIPDYSVVAGVPAKVIKRYDKNKKEWIKI